MKIYFVNTWKTNEKMERVTALANSLMNDEDFLNEIAMVDAFAMSDVAPSRISEFINIFTGQINIKYYKGSIFSSALAYFTPSRPYDININTRKMNRSDGSLVATLVHELIHAVDKFAINASFGHGDNKWTPEKEYTAPYYIDKIAEAFIDKKPIHEGNVNDNIAIPTVNKSTWTWWKPWTWF